MDAQDELELKRISEVEKKTLRFKNVLAVGSLKISAHCSHSQPRAKAMHSKARVWQEQFQFLCLCARIL